MLLVILFTVHIFIVVSICANTRKHRKHQSKRHPKSSSRRKHSRKPKTEKDKKPESSSGDKKKVSHSSNTTTITPDEDNKVQIETTEERGSVILGLPSKIEDADAETSDIYEGQTTEENVDSSMKSQDHRNNGQTSAISNLNSQVQSRKQKRSAEGIKKISQLPETKNTKKCVTFNEEVQVKSETETTVNRHDAESMTAKADDMTPSHILREGFFRLYKASLIQSLPNKHERNISTPADEAKVEINEDTNKKPSSTPKSDKKKHRKERKGTESTS